jgi:hypothetical protein
MDNRERKLTDKFELDTLLHPASAFAHPMDVVRDPDLTLNEKRAILASWASDACAVEAAPDLRANASGRVVRWDEMRCRNRKTSSIRPASFSICRFVRNVERACG